MPARETRALKFFDADLAVVVRYASQGIDRAAMYDDVAFRPHHLEVSSRNRRDEDATFVSA